MRIGNSQTVHRPVLLKEVLKIFNPQPGQIYIDATINGGGHASAIAEKIGSSGKLLGIDIDCDLIKALEIKNQSAKIKNTILTCDSYASLADIVSRCGLTKISGILFDLGFSSYHLEKSGRGFSFQKDEPLDMRYNISNNELTAEKIINNWDEGAIETLLREYGGERFARRIARGILRARNQKKIATTAELVAVIKRNVPYQYLKAKINPATRTFQALRMAVNKELENLEKALPPAAELLKPAGKLVIISFHSLEDRVVKNFFKQKGKEGNFKILTPKPIIASVEELKTNPRARSAKLRAIQRI